MKLQDKHGRLTAYAYACGYVTNLYYFRLWREHGVYHVNGTSPTAGRIWQSYRTLTDARKGLRTLDNMYGPCGEERKRMSR